MNDSYRLSQQSPVNHTRDLYMLKRNGWLLAAAWTLIILTSFFWNSYQEEEKIQALALNSLELSFEKDLVYRRWAATHGGVYVPAGEETPPNPYLAHVPERDIITDSGVHLTLVNPAYMTRQVHEMGREQYGLEGNITSLDPLRPENAPDDWERKALESFTNEECEAVAVKEIGGKPHMRFMRPFVTEESCLQCHARQGYELGDIQGGISVSMPVSSYISHIQSRTYALLAGHSLIWFIGICFIGWMTLRMIDVRTAGETERRKAEEKLQRMNETLEQKVSERTRLAEKRSEQLRSLTVELVEAEEKERRRIADLLHEDMQQLLASAKLHLQSIDPDPSHKPLLEKVDHMLKRAIDNSRELAHELSPAVVHHYDLTAALNWLVRYMDKRFGLKVRFDADNIVDYENTPLKLFIFRAVQELLFNVTKHAGVDEASVELLGSEHGLQVSVADRGRGFDSAILDSGSGKEGLGLLSLKERAKTMGGILMVKSIPGQGSRFTLWLPLEVVGPEESTAQM